MEEIFYATNKIMDKKTKKKDWQYAIIGTDRYHTVNWLKHAFGYKTIESQLQFLYRLKIPTIKMYNELHWFSMSALQKAMAYLSKVGGKGMDMDIDIDLSDVTLDGSGRVMDLGADNFSIDLDEEDQVELENEDLEGLEEDNE